MVYYIKYEPPHTSRTTLMPCPSGQLDHERAQRTLTASPGSWPRAKPSATWLWQNQSLTWELKHFIREAVQGGRPVGEWVWLGGCPWAGAATIAKPSVLSSVYHAQKGNPLLEDSQPGLLYVCWSDKGWSITPDKGMAVQNSSSISAHSVASPFTSRGSLCTWGITQWTLTNVNKHFHTCGLYRSIEQM